jgi:hypothetical protein
MRSSRKWVFGTTRGLSAPLVILFTLCLGLVAPAKSNSPAVVSPEGVSQCVSADALFLSLNKPTLDKAHALAADGQLEAAILRFELLLNQLEGHLTSQSALGAEKNTTIRAKCESLRQYAFDVYSAYAFGLALEGESELAGAIIQQMVNQDISAVLPLSQQNKARLLRFARQVELPVLFPSDYLPDGLNLGLGSDRTDLSSNSMSGALFQSGVDHPAVLVANPSVKQTSDQLYGSVLLRMGKESNVSFAPSRSTLNLFTDFGLIEVDLGENFKRRSGWVGLLDGQIGRRYSLNSGIDLEVGAAMRVRQATVDSGDTESLSLSSSVYGLNQNTSGELSRLKDRITLTYEVKTLFQQKVNSTELAYEQPLELQFARLEPQVSYRLVNYDFSSSNARQVRLGLTMIPLHVASVDTGVWGPIDYRPGVRIEWINDRAASPDRLGGEQFEGGIGVFVQAKWGGWYAEASANGGRRASEDVYSNFLLPGARLLLERSSIGIVAKKAMNSSDTFVLNFQKDWQRSSIELFQTDNQSFYLGFERRF